MEPDVTDDDDKDNAAFYGALAGRDMGDGPWQRLGTAMRLTLVERQRQEMAAPLAPEEIAQRDAVLGELQRRRRAFPSPSARPRRSGWRAALRGWWSHVGWPAPAFAGTAAAVFVGVMVLGRVQGLGSESESVPLDQWQGQGTVPFADVSGASETLRIVSKNPRAQAIELAARLRAAGAEPVEVRLSDTFSLDLTVDGEQARKEVAAVLGVQLPAGRHFTIELLQQKP